MRKIIALFAFLLVAIPGIAHAQNSVRQRLSFPAGASQSVVIGSIVGRQTIDYIVSARLGQTMSIRFQPDNRAAFFNLIAPGGRTLFVGQTKGNPGRFNARLGQTGDYIVRLYLVPNATRRAERALFRLAVSVTGIQPQPVQPALPEFPGVADDGGPDFYVVRNLTPGDRLNMRRAPTATAPVVNTYGNGKILRNLGCRRTATQRWCHVENPEGTNERGYVNGRFLGESAG